MQNINGASYIPVFRSGWLTTGGANQGSTKIDILFRRGETHRLPRARARIIPVRYFYMCVRALSSFFRIGYTRRAFGWPLSRAPAVMNSNKAHTLMMEGFTQKNNSWYLRRI